MMSSPKSDSSWQFQCARCESPLSGALEELSVPSDLVRPAAGWPAIPAGFFVPPQEQPLPGLEAFSGGWLVANDSLQGVSFVGEADGCCGPSGRSGPNLACAAGHLLGTLVADCDNVGGACLSVERVLLRPAPADAARYRLLTFAPSAPITDVADFVRWLCVEVDLPLRRPLGPVDWPSCLDDALETWRARAREPAVVVWRRCDLRLDASVAPAARTAFTALVTAFRRHKPFLTLFWTP